MEVLVPFALVLLAWVCYRHHKEFKDFPPGYRRLPWLGSVFSLVWRKASHVMLEATEMVPRYGPIVGFVLGKVKMVVISDFDLAKDVFRGDRFARRQELDVMNERRGHEGRPTGIVFTSGELWRTHRRFALTALKEFGMGKSSMDSFIVEEADHIASFLARQVGSDYKIEQTFNAPAFNTLWVLVSGKRFESSDPWFKNMHQRLAAILNNVDSELPFPILARIFPSRFMIEEKKHHYSDLKGRIAKEISEHQEKLGDGFYKPKDLIEAYIIRMRTNPALNIHDLVGMGQDFFEAGGESVGTSMSWIILHLALEQEVQEKCYQEIHGTLGQKKVQLDERQRLPFCEATILEVQRLACVGLGSLDHSSTEDNWIGGYKIPKFVNIYYNIHHFHTDPAYWGDPEVFRPDRFLKEVNGVVKVVKPERFVPFGLGSRACIGQTLASATLFIFTITILQAVKILPPLNHEMPDSAKFTCGLTKSPQPFHVQFQACMYSSPSWIFGIIRQPGNKQTDPQRFVPFGFEKRVCMGESLARAELFIFTVMILQAVKILPPEKQAKPDPSNFVAGLTKNTLPYHVRFTPR